MTMVSPAEGTVTSRYGRRRPIPGVTVATFHAGIDVANRTGTPIHAAYAGTVVKAGQAIVKGRSGNGILIRNPDGEHQYYGHLARIRVRVGQRVAAGERIGDMGATGNVTGPHLHFETWNRDLSTRDPRTDFRRAGIAPGSRPVQPVGSPGPVPAASTPAPAPRSGPRPHRPAPVPTSSVRPSVVDVKRALAAIGLFTGAVSSTDTKAFRSAVAAYQRRQVLPAGGLRPDGDWGSTTQSHFDWVRRLQATLNRWKGDAITVDGDYYTRTRDRVAHTQRRNGLVPDGQAGPVTCRLLGIEAHPQAAARARAVPDPPPATPPDPPPGSADVAELLERVAAPAPISPVDLVAPSAVSPAETVVPPDAAHQPGMDRNHIHHP